MVDRLFVVVLYALALVFVAVALAAGARLVDWLVGDPVAVWKAALALIAAAAGGAGVIAAIRGSNGNR